MSSLTPTRIESALGKRLAERALHIPSSYFNGHMAQFVLSVGSEVFGVSIEPEALCVSDVLPTRPDFRAEILPEDFRDLETARSDVMTLVNTGRVKVSPQTEGTDALKSLQYAITLLLSRWYLTAASIDAIEAARPGYLLDVLPRLDADDHDGFRALSKQGSAVLISGMADDWPMRRVGFDALLETARNIPVTLLRREHGPDSPAKYEVSTLHDYVESIRAQQEDEGARAYLAANAIPPELEDMVGLPGQFAQDAFANTRMWIGPPGTGLKFHRDMVDNFIVQAFGRKNLSLIAPHHAADMRPERLGGNPFYHPSGRDLRDEAAASSALKPETLAARIEVTLDEGDAIYLPAGWWHQVRNVTLSWSFNFFAVNQPPLVLGSFTEGKHNEQ